MSNKPQPSVQSFLICREIFQDTKTNANLLVSPFCRLNLPVFPATLPVSLYIQLTGGRGTYHFGIQLHDSEGRALADVLTPKEEALTDPVAYAQLTWRDMRLKFPRPGHYSLVVFADREEIGRHSLDVSLTIRK